MNTIATLLIVSAALAVVSGAGYGGASAGGSGGYGAASIPAPPCPKNYLFSCQPNLAPAPCAPPAASYGSAGAYSENVPTILNAPYGYQGLPQQLNQFPNYYGQIVGGN
ncbi:vitelline membrane protein Vm26Aa-like [Calliphora vicina]|uniref:vitelline membrane protein Vm26Aa-like n=1 Tax=Calliphora vicina TaxID=7373 RepID=UPI00325A5E46